ncbi:MULTISPECIES: ABC transporter substrate-binding protein [unclassified Variovorax]|uniref:ABC transporter substrate-binding protein n=1 Tax=unclassified Variovorax TaxID=663243 RepID=UPI0008B24033|nr:MULTISPECIES: ABC transporter substrate-binding protein [unclassified Variovorax]SEK13260.1 amino acid/amide ABC transporter substrate-binding protein, HAAT family [Variovorax sp. OK202]SFD86764.1 amino acid/amide ABC transporter substrate-binding protein, HAAT family [Variovorax sp. OK212]
MNQVLKLAATTLAALVAGPAFAQISDETVKIGVIVDMSGVYSANGGMGAVRAVEMAVKDFGGKVQGKPIQVVSADYQNKVDVASSKARQWYDVEKVDLIIESTDSAASIAMQKVALDKKKPIIFAGSATTALTNKECSPYGIHWVYDTYALATGTGRAVMQEGGSSWYFVTADYAFGHSLERDTSAVVNEMGGKVLGSAKHPLNASDFASFLLQAQSSKAKVVGLANAGKDTQNAVRQAAEFGITKNQTLATLLVFDTDIKGLGLPAAQGMMFTTGFYWDANPETREFGKRFFDIHKGMPTMIHAGAYSAAMHYLKAIDAKGTDSAETVLAQMHATPVNDFFAKGGKIRADGRMVHDMYLAEVKKPSESKGEWDMIKIKRTIPGDEAFQPLAASTCNLVKRN